MMIRTTSGVPTASAASVRRHGNTLFVRPAFTLIEIVLGLVVLAMLMAVVVLNLVGWQSSRDLDEGTMRFEAMLRMARAEAANNARRMKLTFTPDTGEYRLQWEPDPIGQPNQFVDYDMREWASEAPLDLVKVVRCELTGPSTYRTLFSDQFQADRSADTVMDDVMFYPDGSCDAAVIELASLNEDELRHAIVELDGLNGTVSTRILTPTEMQQWQDSNMPLSGSWATDANQ